MTVVVVLSVNPVCSDFIRGFINYYCYGAVLLPCCNKIIIIKQGFDLIGSASVVTSQSFGFSPRMLSRTQPPTICDLNPLSESLFNIICTSYGISIFTVQVL